jgi:hypothetical protein
VGRRAEVHVLTDVAANAAIIVFASADGGRLTSADSAKVASVATTLNPRVPRGLRQGGSRGFAVDRGQTAPPLLVAGQGGVCPQKA